MDKGRGTRSGTQYDSYPFLHGTARKLHNTNHWLFLAVPPARTLHCGRNNRRIGNSAHLIRFKPFEETWGYPPFPLLATCNASAPTIKNDFQSLLPSFLFLEIWEKNKKKWKWEYLFLIVRFLIVRSHGSSRYNFSGWLENFDLKMLVFPRFDF